MRVTLIAICHVGIGDYSRYVITENANKCSYFCGLESNCHCFDFDDITGRCELKVCLLLGAQDMLEPRT